MSSQAMLAVSTLEYCEAGGKARAGLHLVSAGERQAEADVAMAQMRREIDEVRERTTAEVESRMRLEMRAERDVMTDKVADVLERFEGERKRYFLAIELELVRLAMGIARKILQREAELDPTLLAALVRIALERMEAGSDVRVRVPARDADRWRGFAERPEGSPAWQVVVDVTLTPGDCMVETALGQANFGFEAQLADVEKTLLKLVAQRPGAV